MTKTAVLLLLALLTLPLDGVAAAVRDTIGSSVESLDWHLRVEAAKSCRTRCRIVWNADTAMLNFRYCDIVIPEAFEQDGTSGIEPSYTLGHCVAGREEESGRGSFRTSYPSGSAAAMSMRLRADGRGARIEAGGARADGIIEISFERDKAGIIGADLDRDVKILRHSLRAFTGPEPKRPPFASTAEALSLIAGSTDPREGIWEYLDRDIDATRCTLGAFYTLVSLRSDADGCYEIYAIDKSGVKEPQYKGCLIPGIFMNHYDLQWVDARGHLHDTDASATTDENASVLTLSFPLLKSSVRFRRMPISRKDN